MATKSTLSKHTLDKIADKVREMGITELVEVDKNVYTASLIGFIEAVYDTMASQVWPNSIFHARYDPDTNTLMFKERNGYCPEEVDGALDMKAIDFLVAFDMRSTQILQMGDTGAGKTFAAEEYNKTVLAPDNYQNVRLSGNPMQNNLLSYFVKTRVDEDGNFETVIQHEALDKTARIHIDEASRGDSQAMMQIIEARIDTAGHQKADIGPYVPELTNEGIQDTRRKKKVQVTCSTNPPASVDAKFTQSQELDAASLNRMIKEQVPNAAKAFGTSIWLANGQDHQYERMLDKWCEVVSNIFGMEKDEIYSEVDRDWLSIYAYTLDPRRTDKNIYYSALELGDLFVQVLSGDLKQTAAVDAQTVENRTKVLGPKYQVTAPALQAIDETDNDLQVLEGIVKFNTTIVPRDIAQLQDLGDVISTIKEIMRVFNLDDPFEAYLKNEDTLQVDDVSIAAAILAKNKDGQPGKEPLNAINTTIIEYTKLATEYEQKLFSDTSRQFSMDDPDSGIKNLAIKKALHSAKHSDSFNVDTIIKNLYSQMSSMQSLDNGSQVRRLIINHSASDLATLAGFMDKYKGTIDQRLSKLAGKGSKGLVGSVFEELGKIYVEKRDKIGTVTFPGVYIQRLPRTLGRNN